MIKRKIKKVEKNLEKVLTKNDKNVIIMKRK